MSRCAVCNGPGFNGPLGADEIVKATHGSTVPPGVLGEVAEFWECANASCGKIYWEGPKFSEAHSKFSGFFSLHLFSVSLLFCLSFFVSLSLPLCLSRCGSHRTCSGLFDEPAPTPQQEPALRSADADNVERHTQRETEPGIEATLTPKARATLEAVARAKNRQAENLAASGLSGS